jgi:hypothetical protein
MFDIVEGLSVRFSGKKKEEHDLDRVPVTPGGGVA